MYQFSPEFEKVSKDLAKPIDTGGSLVDRSLGYLLGAPTQIIEQGTKLVGNIAGFDGSFIKPGDQITPASTTGGKIIDFAGNLLPSLATYELGSGLVSGAAKLTGLASAAPVVTSALKSAAGFGAAGLVQSRETGADEAGIGAAIGASHVLPLMYRVPAAIGLGLLSKAIFDARHPEASQGYGGLITGVGNAAVSLFAPQIKLGAKLKAPVADGFATVAKEPNMGEFGGVRESFVNPTPEVPPQPVVGPPDTEISTPLTPKRAAEIKSSLQGMSGITTDPVTGEPIQAMPEPTPPPPLAETSIQRMQRLAADSNAAPTPKIQSLVPEPIAPKFEPLPPQEPVTYTNVPKAEPPPKPEAPVTVAPVHIETSVERAVRLKAEADAYDAGPKPTFKAPSSTNRIEEVGSVGGGRPNLPNPVLPPDFGSSLVPALARAGVGGVAGAMLAGPDATTQDRIIAGGLGAAAAVAAPAAIDALKKGLDALKGKTGPTLATVAKTEEGAVGGGGGMKMKSQTEPVSPHDFVPALREPNGNIIEGQKGDIHKDIKSRQPQDWQDQNVLADAEGNGAEHGFVKGGQFHSREQASEALGLKTPLQSETLRDLQSLQKPEPIEKQSNKFFAPEAFQGIEGFKSRSKIFYMPIEDFKNLAHPLVDLTRKPAAREASEAGKKWTSLPQIMIEKGRVVSHEGRNRAEYLESKGMKYMPVEIRDRLNRWDEMTSDNIPKELLSESKSGYSIPFNLKSKSELGSVMPELSAFITRAAVGGVLGGLVGGHFDTNGDTSGFVTGALFGAAALSVGPEVGLGILKKISKAELPAPTKGLNWAGDLKKTFAQGVEERAGNVIHGSTRVADRFISWLDHQFGATMPVAVSRTLREAEGTATHLLDTADAAMNKLSSFYKAPKELRDAANKYLDGGSREEFLQPLQNDQDKLYAQYVVAARESINGLQRMVASGVGDAAKAQLISDSIGQYMTKSYKLFTRDGWTPEPSVVDKLAAKMKEEKLWLNSSEGEIKDYLYSYIREVQSAKGMYRGAKTREGQAIDQTLLKARKDLSDQWREFLGEVTNPAERISQTLYRLRPMAAASKFMHDIAVVMKDGDMPHYFRDRGELEAFKATHLQRLQDAPDAVGKQKIALQLSQLDNFQPLEAIPKYGELRGGLVSRSVWNTLSTYDSITSLGSHPWMRSVSGLNVAAKLSNTALNPISFVRNVFQMPMMMMIGRANMSDVLEGLKILHDPAHPLREEIISQGIGSADQLKQEIFRDFNAATEGKFQMGNMDSANLSIGSLDAEAVRKGFGKFSNKYLDIYRSPDNAVRIGTYLSAKRRIAEALGKGLDDLEVIQKATDFTNRYTMDYGSVAPIIKNVRQIPGVNLYISYISEMSRITKNVLSDLVHGGDGITAHDRLYAAMPIAFLGALPEVMNSNAESSLSPSDRADWEKAKNLMPDYARTRYRANIKREADGSFTYTDFTPLIPTDFIHQSTKALANGDLKALASVNPFVSLDNSPALNIVVEQSTGKDIHTQRDFRGFSDRVASVAKEVLPPWLSIGREGRKFEQAYTPNQEGGLGLTNLRTGQKLTPADFWLPYETALRTGSYDLSVLQRNYTSEVKRDIANNTAYLNDILKSDAAPEVKEREKVKFAKVYQELIHSWQDKMGITQGESQAQN